MKAYPTIREKNIYPAILLFIIVLLSACASTKYIEDYQSIVKKLEIDSVDKRFEEQAYSFVQKDIRPTPALSVGVPLYNFFNVKDGKYKTANIKSFGTAPAILDSTLVEISRTQIEKFLKSKGYFRAKVKSEIAVQDKIANVTFKVDPASPYHINKFETQIADANIASLVDQNKSVLKGIKEGMQYDDDSLSVTRDHIYTLMKENGYYDFLKPYVRYEVDTNLNVNKANLKLFIDNPEGKKHHPVYVLGRTNIIVAPNTSGFPDSIRYKLSNDTLHGVRYTDFSHRFRRNPIERYNFLQPGEIYDVRKENLTYDRIYQLNTFKNVKIDFRPPSDTLRYPTPTLIPVIQLIPQKIMSNRIEGEVPFNSGTVGFTVSNTYTNSNLFRGMERFELQLKGGLYSRMGDGAKLFSDIYQRDFSVSASISVPRLIIPFYNPKLGANGMPRTTFSSSYVFALQQNIFVRNIIINSVTYDWFETKSKLHSLSPLNFEYRFGNVRTDQIDTEDLINNLYYINLIDRKDITWGVKYAYTLNAEKLNQYRSFVYLRGNMESAGNMLSAMNKLFGRKHNPEDLIDGKPDYATIFGLPYNQFVRPELDIRWYKHLGGERQFIARLNSSFLVYYGNSIDAPFEKYFFAGGSNGIRAWQARTLGPGNYNREVLATEALRRALYGLDQMGEMRLESNLEYRFKLLDKFFGAKLKGAVFVDAGNIWDLKEEREDDKLNDADHSEKVFKFKNLGKQLAIGAGIGLRYDVSYFVFRFDVGMKIKDPQFSGKDQWVVQKYFTGAKDFRAQYDLSHSPDRYRFLQYNFGIGMPF